MHFKFVVSLATLLLAVAVASKNLYYDFDIKYINGSEFNGVFKKKILTVNGLFPGPPIEAMVGDWLHVTVRNNIQDGQNTSIHWVQNKFII